MKEERKRYKELEVPKEEIEVEEIEVEEKMKKDHPILKKIGLITFLLCLSLFIYGKTIGNKIIDIKEYKIADKTIPTSWHGMKVIQFSDIQYGTSVDKKQLEKIINKINDYHPDIIFFTGDLIEENISINEDTKEEIITLLNKLDTKLYKYAIYGDADLKNDNYKEIMERANFILLENEAKLLYYEEETPVLIAGFTPTSTNPNYSILTNYIEQQDPSSYYKIILTHEPKSIDSILPYNPNIIMIGHSLGGVIKPFHKPLFIEKEEKKYQEETYTINNTHIFISNGLGTTKYNIRLFNHPSINLYRFYAN